jgi:hypothetical protein
VNPALLDQHAHLVRGFVVVVVVVVGMRCMHLSSCSALCKPNGESVLIQTQPPLSTIEIPPITKTAVPFGRGGARQAVPGGAAHGRLLQLAGGPVTERCHLVVGFVCAILCTSVRIDRRRAISPAADLRS